MNKLSTREPSSFQANVTRNFVLGPMLPITALESNDCEFCRGLAPPILFNNKLNI